MQYTESKSMKPGALTNRTSVPFSIRLQPKLMRGYTFKELSSRQLKEWQNFLDLVSQMTFLQVDKSYRRESDPQDTYQGSQVIHYGFGNSFRIHGIIENGAFVLLRLDPTHKFHD